MRYERYPTHEPAEDILVPSGRHRVAPGLEPVSSWIIVVASLLTLAAMTLRYLNLRTRLPHIGDPGFLPYLADALSLLSAVVIIWETIPMLSVPACS